MDIFHHGKPRVWMIAFEVEQFVDHQTMSQAGAPPNVVNLV
jgi:hypothetical protein